ncbi:uncharacterized protein LOC144130119 isoform X2 [Amblyomma americanum]
MSTFSSDEALPAKVLEERAKIMQNAGVHMVFPNGRSRDARQIYGVNGFSGFTFRIYGIIVDNSKKFYMGLTLNDGEADTEINQGYPRSYNIATHSGYPTYPNLNIYLANNTFFSLAVRLLKADRDYYQNFFFDQIIDALAKAHGAFDMHASTNNSSYTLISIHVSNEFGGAFTTPIHEIPNLAQIIPGTFISCLGKYTGSDAISVIKDGGTDAVADLDKPPTSPSDIKIIIRRAIESFLYITDYDKIVLVGAVDSLGQASTLDRVPKFSSNFGIKHMFLETS